MAQSKSSDPISEILNLIEQDDYFGQDPATISAYRKKRRGIQDGLLEQLSSSLIPKKPQAANTAPQRTGQGSFGAPGPRASADQFMNSYSGDNQRRQREMGDYRNTRQMTRGNMADERNDAGIRLEMERQNEKKRLADRAALIRLIGGGGQKTSSSQTNGMDEQIVQHYGRVFNAPTRSSSSVSQQSNDPMELINLILSSL